MKTRPMPVADVSRVHSLRYILRPSLYGCAHACFEHTRAPTEQSWLSCSWNYLQHHRCRWCFRTRTWSLLGYVEEARALDRMSPSQRSALHYLCIANLKLLACTVAMFRRTSGAPLEVTLQGLPRNPDGLLAASLPLEHPTEPQRQLHMIMEIQNILRLASGQAHSYGVAHTSLERRDFGQQRAWTPVAEATVRVASCRYSEPGVSVTFSGSSLARTEAAQIGY